MHIIEEAMHWVPLAHDMDQNLEKQQTLVSQVELLHVGGLHVFRSR